MSTPSFTAAALRPLSVGEILDRAFALYRGHFAPFLATALAFYAPLGALQFAAATGAADGMMALVAPFAWLGCTALLLGALTTQAGRAYMGAPATTGEAVGAAFRRIVALVVVFVLTVVGIFLGLFGLLIGAALVWVLLFAAVPVVALEGKGPFTALRRSTELAEGDWMRIFGVLFVALVIAALPEMALQAVVGMAGEGMDARAVASAQALSTVLEAITYPFSVAATVILYYDRRVRAEGLDLQLLEAAISA
ncbi:MAG TPA: hypothetical protein VF665_11705 [Longimicrobium sp.]|uniref:hypothetical protein n=1 Tax=Longimicrobium sp. TaxID=2029185 RepID=UPI002ED8DC23